jgi:hypothetical protein
MPKKTKVIPIRKLARPKVMAVERPAARVILGIGSTRLAFDYDISVTKLAPATGDRPAPVIAIAKKRT